MTTLQPNQRIKVLTLICLLLPLLALNSSTSGKKKLYHKIGSAYKEVQKSKGLQSKTPLLALTISDTTNWKNARIYWSVLNIHESVVHCETDELNRFHDEFIFDDGFANRRASKGAVFFTSQCENCTHYLKNLYNVNCKIKYPDGTVQEIDEIYRQ